MPAPSTLTGAPCWIELSTSDAEASQAFYGELFGWTFEQGGPEYGGYVNCSKNGAKVAGLMQNDGQVGPTDVWALYLSTPDADATAARATAAGATVVVPPMNIPEDGALGRMAFVADVGGAAIGMWQPGQHVSFDKVAEPGTPVWFELLTRDYEPTVAFYQDVFGWETHVESDAPEFRYTTLGNAETQAAGIMDATAMLPEGMPPHWRVYFNVSDVDAAVAKSTEIGATVVEPAMDTPYGRMAGLTDSTGAPFNLHQDL